MSSLLRSILLASLVGFLVVGCGNKEEAVEATSEAVDAATEAVSDTADAVSEAAEEVTEAASSEPGGYEPTEDERVPGITE